MIRLRKRARIFQGGVAEESDFGMNAQTHFVVGAVVFAGMVSLGAVMAEREAELEPKVVAEAAAVKVALPSYPPVDVTPERVKKGEELFTSLGCVACHSADGSMRVGPSMAALYGKDEKMTDGFVVKVDETYLVESLFKPADKVVAGFIPTMPTFQGRIEGEDLNALLAWIKSIQ